jgi:CDP-glycerol glycerophosphotransferase
MEINELEQKIIQKLRTVMIYGFRTLPIKKKKIIFDNWGGQGYGDNPKYIAEELLKSNRDLDLVWLVTDKNEKFPKGIRVVKYGSIRAMYEFATAKIWIDNVRYTWRPKKRKGQFYIHTNHGPFAIKQIEAEVSDRLSKSYVEAAKQDGRICNVILANSLIQEEQYKKYYWLNPNVTILKIGFPRNDRLINFKDDIFIKQKVKDFFSIEEDAYIVLYAPTFRENGISKGYIKDFSKIQKAFEAQFRRKCVTVCRLHPNAMEYAKTLEYSNTVMNGTFYPDVIELAIASDCVISDYSSVIFDFIMLKKPVFICDIDFESYQEERGLNKEYFDLPADITYSMDELVASIEGFDEKSFYGRIEEYLKKYPIYDDGHSAEKISKYIQRIIEN